MKNRQKGFLHFSIILFVVFFNSSCSNSFTAPKSFDTIIFGTVHNRSNEPIENIAVGIKAEKICGDTTNSLSSSVGYTNNKGEYNIRLKGFDSNKFKCLFIRFKDFDKNIYKDTLIEREVSIKLKANPPFDSTQASVVLKKRTQ